MELAYGKEKITFSIPTGVPCTLFDLKTPAPIENPCKKIKAILRDPIASSALEQFVRPGETVCILVNDATRLARSELFLPILLAELKGSGIAEKDISIVFTNGTHRPLSEAEMKKLVGDEVSARIRLFNHNCDHNDELVFMGRTSYQTPVWVNKRVVQADRRILTGSVVHHYFAGFGGGRKALVPGAAGRETIRKNHSLLLDDRAESGRLEGNPVHEDLLEGALLAGGGFLLNTVLDEQQELLGVFAGDMEQAHLSACALADQAYGVEVGEPADVVIAGCGGYPKDVNLYQAHKALDNAFKALKPGGKVIFAARCSEGIGSSLYEEWVDKFGSLHELEAALRNNFVLGGHKAYTVGKLLQKGQVYLVSDLKPEKASRFGFIPVNTMEEAIAEVYADNKDQLTYIMPQGSLSVPRVIGSKDI